MAARRVPLTAAGMAKAMRGRLAAGDPAIEPTGFGIDSRSIAAGQAFFAIVAARDGHEFAEDAAAKGAEGITQAFRRVEVPSGFRVSMSPEGPSKDASDMQVPQMKAGGIVRARRGGTLVNVGEGGQDEAIVPLGRGSGGGASWRAAAARPASRRGARAG